MIDGDRRDPRLEAEQNGEVVLRNELGSEVHLLLQGANLTQWTQNSKPLLLPYDEYPTANGLRPRGGVPVLAPWAGPRTGYDQHGYFRDVPWKLKDLNNGQAIVTYSQGEERPDFPFPLSASYMVNLNSKAHKVMMSLRVTNDGEEPMPFTPGFHPYFFLPEADRSLLKTNINGFNPDIYSWDQPLEIKPVQPSQHIYKLSLPHRGDMIINSSATLPHLVVWSEKHRSSLCVEPWAAGVHGMDEETGQHRIQPGQSAVYSLGMEFRPAA
jgi:galactose mutarotase-like enzyme